MWPVRLAVPVAIGAAALWLSAGSTAAEMRRDAHGPFDVDQVVLEGLAGTVTVRVAEETATRLEVEGPGEAVAAIEVEAEAKVLTVTAVASGNSVTVVERSTIVTGPGATSNVVIGGTPGSSVPAEDLAALAILVEVPFGTGLTLRGFTGTADIGDLGGAVAIEAIGGSVRLGAVAAAELAAVGGGEITAASVTGDLAASVVGDGRIDVAGGTIGRAQLTVTGPGAVSIDAPLESAAVTMVGDGDVRLAAVAEEPKVSRVGGGRFQIGPP